MSHTAQSRPNAVEVAELVCEYCTQKQEGEECPSSLDMTSRTANSSETELYHVLVFVSICQYAYILLLWIATISDQTV